MDTKLNLSVLVSDGDTLDLDDGRVLRLKIAVDQEADINDFDCYGRVCYDRPRENYLGHEVRPEGFTGNAEKLHRGQRSYIPTWWEPPIDVKRGTPQFKQLREIVQDFLDFGFNIVTLEMLDGEDAYGRHIVVDVLSLGGVDSVEQPYLNEILGELAREMGIN